MTSVSVIIPVFNCQRTLERAVNSVIYEPLVSEIIIVDDGSSDDSLMIAKKLAAKHCFFRLLFHPSHQSKGAAASRNLGLAHATSDWIQFLDADDELLAWKIEKQIAFTKEGMSFIVGNAIDCFEDGHQHLRKFIQEPWAGLIAGKLGITSANLWNKEALKKIGGWNESLSSSQEYDLMFRLLKENAQVGFCNQVLTKIYKNKNSISNNPLTQRERINNWVDLRKEIKSYLQYRSLFTLQKNYVYSGYIMDFCKRNNCMELFNGSKILSTIFKNEKNFKQKIHRWRMVINGRIE